MSAKKGEIRRYGGFQLSIQIGLKELRDSYGMVSHFFLGRLKFNKETVESEE